MESSLNNFRIITISGKIATGTSTLAKNLINALGWRYVNVGEIQRQYDRDHQIAENRQGALSRPDDHEKEIDAMTKKMVKTETHIIYEAWLAGYITQGIDGVLKVLLTCSHDEVRIDRVVNRDNITIIETKQWIKQREEENLKKWQQLYGPYDFWHPKYFDLVIDTYSSGPMETLGKVLDKLGFRGKLLK